MKALTVCQPYAHLITLPDSHPEHKRVENRVWGTHYRGPLAIHAGKSRSWLEEDPDRPGYDLYYDIPLKDMAFGAVVCVADLVDCVHVAKVEQFRRFGIGMRTGLRWMLDHKHTNGPYCFVLANVRVLPTPLPFKGSQGFFEVPDAAIEAALGRAGVAR